MKSNYISIIVLSILSFACEDRLNISPVSVISSGSMWQSSGDADAARYGMYARLRGAFSRDYIHWGDYRSGFFGDATGSQVAFQDLYDNTLDELDRGTNWEDLYTTINDANLILKYVPDIDFSIQEEKDEIMADAYFARALCYFYIARVWGDAPLLLNGFESDDQDDLYPTRTAMSKIFDQVATDIETAISMYPNDDANGRKIGSKAAANMLKADYCLWMTKTQGANLLTEAQTAVDYVLGNSNYQLLDNYETVFRNDENEDLIFALNFQLNEAEGTFATDWLVAVQYLNDVGLVENPVKVGSHQQWTTFTPAFEAFLKEDPTDTRAVVSIDTYDEAGNQLFRWINKYLGEWSDGSRFFTSDIRIYRLAEAYMFKAEIENALGDQAASLSALNEITTRAYGVSDYYSGSYTTNELDDIILNERLKEFAAEGKSWWDLIRFGEVFNRVPSLVGRENETNILLFPVNNNSINTNPNIEQTEGY